MRNATRFVAWLMSLLLAGCSNSDRPGPQPKPPPQPGFTLFCNGTDVAQLTPTLQTEQQVIVSGDFAASAVEGQVHHATVVFLVHKDDGSPVIMQGGGCDVELQGERYVFSCSMSAPRKPRQMTLEVRANSQAVCRGNVSVVAKSDTDN